MIVQIYEIHAPREAERCLALGVDHIGSVLVSAAEWRQPQIREVAALVRDDENDDGDRAGSAMVFYRKI